jgi:cytidine deaminase
MKNLEIVCRLKEYESEAELSREDADLIRKARESMKSAYAPYSRFHVGAAVLLENGLVVTGNNQENASYPTGLCAERVAVFSAGANYPGIRIRTVAIAAYSENFSVNKPVPPCGSCRQALVEYESRYENNIRILMTGESGKIVASESVRNLLPFEFNSGDLKNTKR